jgi:hypothetical protein
VKRLLFLLLYTLPLIASSQQRNTHNLFWVRLALSDTINDKLKWEFSLQQRSQNNYSSDANIFHSFQFKSYMLLFQYALSRNVNVSFSPFGYYMSHALNNNQTDTERPSTKEFRWNIRLDHETNGRYFIYINRINVEFRWRDIQKNGAYQGNWRIRYMMRLDKPVLGILSPTKPVIFTLFDEVFFQFGDAVKSNHTIFDQNRIYAGAAYEIFPNTNLNLAYLYGFQVRSSGKEYDDINTYHVGLTFENFISQFSKSRSKSKSNSNAPSLPY